MNSCSAAWVEEAATRDCWRKCRGRVLLAREHQPPLEPEVQQQEREQRQAPRERWEVALGPWRPKNNSPSPRDRKKKQQAARRRDKERSQQPYQLRSRGNKGERQEEELSD
jgi:hypothetical protein